MSPLIALAILSSAKTFDMQSALNSIRTANKLPGMGAAVITTRSGPHLWFSGVRKVGEPDLVQLHDHWHLGSNTKAMTAAVVASFVQQGAFKYSDKVKTLLGLTTQIAYFKDYTLDDLVRMKSHLDHDPKKTWWFYEGLAGRTIVSKRRAASGDMYSVLPSENMSGAYHYSNASFVFAGLAAELYSKTPIESLLMQRIFSPLHLMSAAYGPNPAGQPWPHVNGVPVASNGTLDNPSVMTGAGRVRLSLPDWAVWCREVMKSIRGETSILPPTYGQRLAQAPSNDYYIDGWIKTTRSWSKGPVYTHAGSNTMNFSVAWLAPTEGVAYLAVTNDGGNTAGTGTDQAVATMITNNVR